MSTGAANISVDCPGCGKRFSVAAQHAGKKGKCKACGAAVAIPSLPAQHQAEDDLYEMAPTDAPAPVARIAAAPAAEPTVLGYSQPAAPRAREAERFDPSDPFEANKFKNLYLPLILILGTAIFNLISETVFTKNPTGGMLAASITMIVKLLIEIPVMLVACLLAVKFLDAGFGPLLPAIIKLSAIALVPDAVSDVIFLVAYLIGRASGSPLNSVVDMGVGRILGWGLSLIVYFRLFMYFFDLDLGETFRLVIFVWFVRLFFTWLIFMFVLSFWMH